MILIDSSPFTLLKVHHTMWNHGTVARTGARSFSCTIQMLPAHATIVLGAVIAAFRFLGVISAIFHW
jgi:hypothetical protein